MQRRDVKTRRSAAGLIDLDIDGQTFRVPAGATLLRAAEEAGIWIPRLCHLKSVVKRVGCRMCLVEVDGLPAPVPACATAAVDGMIVDTTTLALRAVQRSIMEFHLLEHGRCGRVDCELEKLADRLGATGEAFKRNRTDRKRMTGNDFITVNIDLCAHCDRCIRVCRNDVIERYGRGPGVGLCFDAGDCLRDSRCTGCGDCVAVCPTGALRRADLTAGLVSLSEAPD